MVDELTVRRCVAGDMAALAATEPPGSGIASNLMRNQASGGVVYGAAWRDGRPIGTVILDLTSDHAPELKHSFVLEDARGAGAGAALYSWAENQATQAGFEKLYLGVGIQNRGARRLYERLGFMPLGGRPRRPTTMSTTTVRSSGQPKPMRSSSNIWA